RRCLSGGGGGRLRAGVARLVAGDEGEAEGQRRKQRGSEPHDDLLSGTRQAQQGAIHTRSRGKMEAALTTPTIRAAMLAMNRMRCVLATVWCVLPCLMLSAPGYAAPRPLVISTVPYDNPRQQAAVFGILTRQLTTLLSR